MSGSGEEEEIGTWPSRFPSPLLLANRNHSFYGDDFQNTPSALAHFLTDPPARPPSQVVRIGRPVVGTRGNAASLHDLAGARLRGGVLTLANARGRSRRDAGGERWDASRMFYQRRHLRRGRRGRPMQRRRAIPQARSLRRGDGLRCGPMCLPARAGARRTRPRAWRPARGRPRWMSSSTRGRRRRSSSKRREEIGEVPARAFAAESLARVSSALRRVRLRDGDPQGRRASAFAQSRALHRVPRRRPRGSGSFQGGRDGRLSPLARRHAGD